MRECGRPSELRIEVTPNSGPENDPLQVAAGCRLHHDIVERNGTDCANPHSDHPGL